MATRGSSMLPALRQEDHDRLRMGRLLAREEHEGRLLVEGHGGGHYLRRLLGIGVDWTRPAVRSSRPRTSDGRQSFVFNHRTVSKRRWLSAKQSRTGAPKLVGVGPGTTKKFAAYIRRDSAVEQHDGAPSVAGCDVAFHAGLWDAIETHERRDGRIQSRIVAELPYEREIGPQGRLRILERLGQAFDVMRLPWMGAVHRPDAHSDRRNYHLHLIYHDRPAYEQPGEHLGVKAAALERKGIATNIGSRNAAREFDYRLGLTGRKLRALAEETREATRHVFDLVPEALGRTAHQEFVDAAQILIEAAEGLIHARAGEATALLRLDLALWMAEATPSRFEQVAASGTLEPATAERLAHQLRLRANDACVRAIDDVDTARRRTQEAARLLDDAWQRFTEERRIYNRRFQRRALAWLKKREAEDRQMAVEPPTNEAKPVKSRPLVEKRNPGLTARTTTAPPPTQADVRSPIDREKGARAGTAPGSGAVEAGPGQLPNQPGDDVVEPLKLRQDQEATPVLEEKSPKQLLAIRKATTQKLAERSREQGPWASGQARLLRQGLRALDAHLKARGIETAQPNTKHRRRPRGFEL